MHNLFSIDLRPVRSMPVESGAMDPIIHLPIRDDEAETGFFDFDKWVNDTEHPTLDDILSESELETLVTGEFVGGASGKSAAALKSCDQI